MYSRIDIVKKLGKEIAIFPIHKENFKENSINLSASKYAWTLGSGTIIWDKEKNEFRMCNSKKKEQEKRESVKLKRGDNACVSCCDDSYIVFLPHSVTLIETEETLAVGGKIGGTYHSKVGLAAKGLGHISTMLGPNFAGHSLVPVHNPTDEVIKLKVGNTFVSVVFHELQTKLKDKNPTKSGHTEKMTELGVLLKEEESEFLEEDWKVDFKRVAAKMEKAEDYKD